jgi:hypothetical protein
VSTAAGMRIERLALRVAGLDEGAARVLARMVAKGLAPGIPGAAGLPGGNSIGMLRVEVRPTAAEAADADLLARRIVAEIRRTLAGEAGR